MNLLQLQKANKHFGTKTIFEEASFSVNAGEHIGVIGPNGAGKSTLFKILVGQQELDSGQIIKSQQLRVGYLEQESEWDLNQTSEEYLEDHCSKKLWELKQIGEGLGLDDDHFKTPLHQLSGGYRMRMKLLYLIGKEPNLMLLDEPTNFLDLESILALESFLQSYEGAFLLISHDREFLRRTTESTLEVEAGDITKFPGHIDDYFEQKNQLRTVLEAQAANMDAKRKHIQEFIDRFGAKASKAKQAQSRMKQLEKMETIEIKDLSVKARIAIPSPIHTGKESLSLEDADLGYQGNIILKDVTVRLKRGTHLGIVGVNGAGKSTLLKSLAGNLPLIKGQRSLGYQVSLGHFSQHSADQLDMEDRIIDALEKVANRDLKKQEILNLAGSLLFSGDDIYKKIKLLSGGEKSRVALGQILLQRCPVLLLDEPTNHLDFETVEALTEALREYDGTIVVVSHDRSFIGRVSNQILEIRDGMVHVYPGTYDEYVWSVQRRNKTSAAPAPTVVSKAEMPKVNASKINAPKGNVKEEIRKQSAKNRDLQNQLLKLEEKLKSFEDLRLVKTEELIKAEGIKATQVAKELNHISEQVIQLESDMLEIMENLEQGLKQVEELKSV
jgi:ATP-binding cassette subfamily F protein 3